MYSHITRKWDAAIGREPGRKNFIQRSIIEPMRQRRRRRSAIAWLERLSDHQLADIGIPRNRIAEAVDGIAQREVLTSPPARIRPVQEPLEALRRAA